MKDIEEVRNDFTDDDNYTHIDVWFIGKEEGKTVAIVDIDNGKVFYIENLFRTSKQVTESINEIKKILNA